MKKLLNLMVTGIKRSWTAFTAFLWIPVPETIFKIIAAVCAAYLAAKILAPLF